ncbi:hypothetical protein D4764_13G0003000 [Takifugu flavidus]|uniref:Uncharacterized protein n=1 Tax=Takifugu flavidus TaxID=433684 RepID=A0A5C6PA92_9TELE|nr:hypothetical protein D4764_13G0003000 [Takifugu flavidus]
MLLRKRCISSSRSPQSSFKSLASLARGSAGMRSVTLAHTQARTQEREQPRHSAENLLFLSLRRPELPTSTLEEERRGAGARRVREGWSTAQLGRRMGEGNGDRLISPAEFCLYTRCISGFPEEEEEEGEEDFLPLRGLLCVRKSRRQVRPTGHAEAVDATPERAADAGHVR